MFCKNQTCCEILTQVKDTYWGFTLHTLKNYKNYRRSKNSMQNQEIKKTDTKSKADRKSTVAWLGNGFFAMKKRH